jgi:hypothetical protein
MVSSNAHSLHYAFITLHYISLHQFDLQAPLIKEWQPHSAANGNPIQQQQQCLGVGSSPKAVLQLLCCCACIRQMKRLPGVFALKVDARAMICQVWFFLMSNCLATAQPL